MNIDYFLQTELASWSLHSVRCLTTKQELFVVMHVTYFPSYVDPVLEFWYILEVGCIADVSEQYSCSIYCVEVT
jgi:hypothetical protein